MMGIEDVFSTGQLIASSIIEVKPFNVLTVKDSNAGGEKDSAPGVQTFESLLSGRSR